jgi:general stress protein 26
MVSRKNYIMDKAQKFKKELKNLFSAQHLAVLATHQSGQPYTSLVAFASTPDLKYLLFVTGTSTRKYSNLQSDPRASLMIDNRSNQAMDVARAMAATATGITDVVSDKEINGLKGLYLAKHPHLEEFFESPSTRLIRLTVSCYYVVSNFQNVFELHINP